MWRATANYSLMLHGSTPHSTGADRSTTPGVDANEAFEMGVRCEHGDDLSAAEDAYRAADELGHPTAAVKLGVLLEERDDFDGAEQAFRRADARGDAVGAFHLAWMLQEGGDSDGAEQAYRRAELRGHPGARANLRMMLAGQGRTDPAPAMPVQEERRYPPPDAPLAAPADLPVSRPDAEAGHVSTTLDLSEEAADALAAALARSVLADAVTSGRISPAEAAVQSAAEPDDDAGVQSSDPDDDDDAYIEPPTAELGRPLRAVPRREAVHSRTDALSTASGRATRPPRRRRAKATKKAEPPAGLMRRVLGVVLPVVAFGAAFSAGASTRTQAPVPVQLAPAASLSRQAATVTPIASVPAPAPLPRQTKPKPSPTATHTTVPADRGIVVPLPPIRVSTRARSPSATTGNSTTTRANTTAAGTGGTSVTAHATGAGSGGTGG